MRCWVSDLVFKLREMKWLAGIIQAGKGRPERKARCN